MCPLLSYSASSLCFGFLIYEMEITAVFPSFGQLRDLNQLQYKKQLKHCLGAGIGATLATHVKALIKVLVTRLLL